uniref:Uncharacterized protein n=1 Tax=Anguilla anguilla TaxID=7936 RepID=A0A0E9VRJ2_ANGAN
MKGDIFIRRTISVMRSRSVIKCNSPLNLQTTLQWWV